MTNLAIPSAIRDQLIAHAVAEMPNECCGFLVGRERVERAMPLQNKLASPVAYSVEVKELAQVARQLRNERLEVLAIYHSHPTSDPIPSTHDLAQNGYGDTVPHVIIGFAGAVPEVRAWILGEASYREVEWGISG